jgi:ribonuclease BN (tRNA processing enzyme)
MPNPALADLELEWRGITVAGASVAALATAFAIDAFKTAIDMGRCSPLLARQETVLLTHCHSDHLAGLVAWLSAHTRRFPGAVTRVVVPAERRLDLYRALELWPDLDGVRRRIDLDRAIVGAQPGDAFDLDGGAQARAFRVNHSSPSLGWRIHHDDPHRPLFVFCGDGTVLPFAEQPQLLDGGCAFVDCTFVDAGTRVAARLGGHAHLDDWITLLPAIGCEVLVLTHLPFETTVADLEARLHQIREVGPQIIPWLAPDRHRP